MLAAVCLLLYPLQPHPTYVTLSKVLIPTWDCMPTKCLGGLRILQVNMVDEIPNNSNGREGGSKGEISIYRVSHEMSYH
jgi:hypothetical protein